MASRGCSTTFDATVKAYKVSGFCNVVSNWCQIAAVHTGEKEKEKKTQQEKNSMLPGTPPHLTPWG